MATPVTKKQQDQETGQSSERPDKAAPSAVFSAQQSGAAANRAGQGAQVRNRQADGKQPSKLQGLSEEQLARGLGWFSIGLGLAELAAPRGLTRLIGVHGNHTGLLRLLGLREIASGIGILTQRRPAAGAWSRVGGDAIDLALLGAAFTSPKADRGRLALATAAVAGVTALDVICSQQLSRSARHTTSSGAIRVTQAIAINRTPEELYKFWRDFQNLPRFMQHLEAVQTIGDSRSHWVAKAPAGTTVEWEAEITQDQPNDLIAWRSLEGADVDNAGSVQFTRQPDGRGTIVKVEMIYSPPAGVIGASIAKLFGEDPEWQVKDDLRRFKQVIETGEIITTEGQSAGRSSGTSWRYDTAVRS